MRPGVMAPPDLYDRRGAAALMAPAAAASHPPVDVRHFLWGIAVLLGVIELLVTHAPT